MIRAGDVLIFDAERDVRSRAFRGSGHLAPLLCANEACPEWVKRRKAQVIAEGERGHVVRGKCSKCREYTTGRV